ncbi:DUF1294 domain-containing protein [Sphingomonas sp. PB2P19]|uniref:DUF1294 domain-containing protein n=1 Tax=Sphingomonas rhamnosi TaxID=3096156 RepID=UPI002FC7C205
MIPAALAFLIVNLATVLTFGRDKQLAVEGGRRIRESTLLWLAAIGGSPGALWARQHYRHKTRKQPFGTQLELIVMMQAGILLGMAFVLLF